MLFSRFSSAPFALTLVVACRRDLEGMRIIILLRSIVVRGIPGWSGNEGHCDNRLRADGLSSEGQFILFEIYSDVVPLVIVFISTLYPQPSAMFATRTVPTPER